MNIAAKNTPILEREISFYTSAFDTNPNPKNITLEQWISAVKNGGSDAKIMQRVQLIRELANKANKTKAEEMMLKNQKEQLPNIMASGVFSQGVKNDDLKKHSGFIAIDIDKLTDVSPSSMRDHLFHTYEEIVFSALSVSGNGVWALIEIAYPDKHKEHFEQLKQDFADDGIILDKSCSNQARRRFYSLDPNALFRINNTIYDRLPVKKHIYLGTTIKEEDAKVEYYINEVISRRLNILEDYHDWYRLAWALIDGLGEAKARDVFLTISSFSDKFNQTKAEAKFDKLIKDASGSVTFGSFIYAAKQADVPKYEPQPINVRLTTRTHKGGAVTVDEYGNYFRGDKGYPDDWDFHLPDYTPLTEQQKANATLITTK